MVKDYEVYGTTAHVLTLDAIPEDGQEVFSIGSYPLIVTNGQIDIDISIDMAHEAAFFGAIGVKDGKTLLVDIEPGKCLTARQMAQFMASVLECKFASLPPFQPILVHNMYTEELKDTDEPVFEINEDGDVTINGGTVEKPKKKGKKKHAEG